MAKTRQLELNMIEKIVDFMRLMAKSAADKQEEIDVLKSQYKGSEVFSVVTETDKYISNEFHRFVKSEFGHLNHVIVDEESLGELGDDKYATLQQAEYQFVIDPIDGTQMYALKMPCYAISIGVMKNCKPNLGVVCLPALGELIYFDGGKVHWIQKLNTIEENDIIVEKNELSRLAVLFDNGWSVKVNDKVDVTKDTLISFYSCVVHFFYMITNRAKGYYFGSYIWDMAGSWPILQAMEFEFRDFQTGKIMTEVLRDDFTKNLKIKNIHVVCREEDFKHLQEIVELRKKNAI